MLSDVGANFNIFYGQRLKTALMFCYTERYNNQKTE